MFESGPEDISGNCW